MSPKDFVPIDGVRVKHRDDGKYLIATLWMLEERILKDSYLRSKGAK